jgi:hypothetical protein
MSEHTRRGHEVTPKGKHGASHFILYPELSKDFEDDPNFISTEHLETHYYATPTECPDHCALVEAERDRLASELALYKLKYGDLLPEDRHYRAEADYVDDSNFNVGQDATIVSLEDQYEYSYYYPESEIVETHPDIAYEHDEVTTEY